MFFGSAKHLGIYSNVNGGTLINSFSGILLLNKSPETSI